LGYSSLPFVVCICKSLCPRFIFVLTKKINMKRFLLLSLILTLKQLLFSQSVGVGTTNPNSSAALDVSSTTKGLLIPRVYLQSAVDNFTIGTPATSLLVYNTNSSMNGGTGMFY